jgi:hypothetical protein
MESNAMLSWRGTTDGAGVVGTGFGELLILLLLGDSRITKGASPKTALDEETMQISQRSDIGARRANLHAGAGGQIQHPGCQHNYYAGCRLNVDNPAAGALLAVLLSNTASVEWMPAVMDLDFLPDMGRMNGRLPSGVATGSSPAQRRGANEQRQSTPSSKHAYAERGISKFMPPPNYADRACFPHDSL